MGKKKNKNKVSGAVKTAAKTEKKLANKLKKELADLGEEDIAKVLAQIEREEAKRSAATEKVLPGAPSARAYASLTPHPTNNELILFGGEYHDGQKTVVYNELLVYNVDRSSWRLVHAPGAPPPRSAHQAVATSANRGELWVFGGEFTSPSETQFHHYRDLWCFSLADKKWEKVTSPNGPSARSGHRMVLLGRKLFVFGGYSDDGRECRYYDDMFTFCLDSRLWSKLQISGRGPSARSACIMLPAKDSIVIYGGFSRVRDGRTERTHTHTDMFRLCVCRKGDTGTGTGTTNFMWRSQSGGSLSPGARAGLAAAASPSSQRGYVFGGVVDVEETEEELVGEMSDDLRMLDLDTCKWHDVTLRGQPTAGNGTTPTPTPKATASGEDGDRPEPEHSVTVVTDEVFTMTLGGGPPPGEAPPPPSAAPSPPSAPCGRMSAMLCVQRATLYLYGGVLEKEDRQFYLSDMYSLDVHKARSWRTLVPQPPLPEWLGSDSEGWHSESGDSDEDSNDTDTRESEGD